MEPEWIKDLLPPGDKFKEAVQNPLYTNQDGLYSLNIPVPKMTVGHLLAFLSSMNVPEDATISLEGCDCVAECRGWTYDPTDNTLEMER